jgi:DNA-binding CsgD family transcriptional regulator
VVDDLPPADPASGDTEPGDTEPAAGERRVLIPPRSVDWHHLRADATFALDDGWCVVSASSGVASLLGWRDADLLGTPIVELTHPDDLSTMLMSFALTTTCSEAAVPLRLGNGRGSWHPVWALVTMSEVDGDQRFSLRLGDGLGAGAARTPAWPEDMLELTIREAEVVSRLLTGQRVATIAREMFLSPRTIRNHLTAVFRKADVHSQDQLIQLLRNPRETS